MINSERPWLDVTPIPHEVAPRNFVFRVENKGRTPSYFVSGSFEWTWVRDPMQDLKQPTYSTPFDRPNEDLLVPGRYFDIPTRAGVNPSQMFADHLVADIINQGFSTLIFYGQIVYDDVLGSEGIEQRHETRWCYACLSGEEKTGIRFIRTGPAEYNRYT